MIFPAWSPNGHWIAYTKKNSSSHGADILLLNQTTGVSKNIFTDTVPSGGISFSPDNKKICFSSSHQVSKRAIYTINIDGTDLQQLTTDTARYFNPQWSPDGKYIAYYTERGDYRDQVWLMRLQDKKEIKLTNDTLHNVYPCWRNDSKSVYYTSSDPHGTQPDLKQIVSIDIKTGVKNRIGHTEGAFYSSLSANGKKLATIKGKFPNTDIFISDEKGKDLKCVTCGLLSN